MIQRSHASHRAPVLRHARAGATRGRRGRARAPLDLGFGIAVSLRFEDSVTDDALAQVRQLMFETDEPFTSSVPIDRPLARVERIVYRPLSRIHALSMRVSALDQNGLVLASGFAALATLLPGETAQLEVSLFAFEHPDAAGLDGAGPVDLAGPDLAVPAVWTLLQQREAIGKHTITLLATHAASLIVVAFTVSASAVSDDASAGGNSYVKAPGVNGCAEIWYANNAKAGATTITVTTASAPDYGIVAWEVAGLDPSQPFDVGAATSFQAGVTPAAGALVTTSTRGEFVVSMLPTAGGVTGIVPGNEFTNDSRVNGNGWAHLTSPDAVAGPHQAIWELSPVGDFCSSTAAFKLAP